MQLVRRVLAIITGYFFAVCGFFAAFSLLFSLAAWLGSWPAAWTVAGLSPVIFAGAPLVAVFAFAATLVMSVFPTAAVVLLAEWLGWRAPWVYAGPAAILAGLTYLVLSPRVWFGLDGAAYIELALFAASGAVAGLVFWAIAGRKAGLWS